MQCSEADCIADFVLRKDVRLKTPGACSLEFQSVMQIVVECILRWDIKKKTSKGKGILGTVLAFFAADEEQGRKTLHRHWQIWVKEIDETLRNCLFHEDHVARDIARRSFCKQIDNVLTASYGSELCIIHKCKKEGSGVINKQDIAEVLFEERDPYIFRRARHKELCVDIDGGLMSCSDCEEIISTSSIINNCLQKWRNTIIPGEQSQHYRPDTIIPLSKERLDMAAYTFSYHMDNGCAVEKDSFWGNKNVRELLLKYRFEEHSACHKASCFKKGCECRFLFPFKSTPSTYIHEDKGDNNEKEILWYSLDGSTRKMCPFLIFPRRPMGSQYVNPHNSAILNVLNCNTNIQIGDVSQVFYSTLYTSKSTQEEDSEKQLRIGRAVMKRIQRLLNDQNSEGTLKDNHVTSESSFREGLCRVLSGLNAATTRNVISATMAHLIPSNGGSRFVFSHDFSDLLVGQMEATLEGQDINVRIRTNKLHNGQLISWADSLADDYIHRPLSEHFEMMSFYEMTQKYRKVFKNLRREGEDRYKFSETHPGHEFSYLMKLKHPSIPRIALPKEKLCPLKDLQLNTTKPTEESFHKREIYAKMALLMFYPFRCLNDLTIERSYWKRFYKELQRHLAQKITKFSQQGFTILQNINDRLTLQKQLKRANDPIYMTTKNEKPINDKNKNNKTINENNEPDILEMGFDSR